MRTSGTYSSASRERSPARQKAEELQEKLQSLGNDDESRSRREFLVQRAKNIYDRLEKSEQQDDARLRLCRDQL